MFLKLVGFVLSGLLSLSAFAQDPHDHHRKHFMVLTGETEVHAYHYVYKVPHNYQVILKVRFDPDTQGLYQKERGNYPRDTFFYYLDPMVIADVASVSELSGSLVREDASGTKTTIRAGIKVPRANFDVVFFDEIPVKLD